MSLSNLYLPRVWMGNQVSAQLLPSTVRPLSAHIKLTENCQAKCISCDYWKSRWQDGIDTGRAIELINQIDALGIRSLRLTGGEPLLRKDLFQVLEKANTSGFKRIILQTNGLLKKLHQEVNASPITNLSVSIDGLKSTNDQIRGIRGYFDLALSGIQLLQKKQVAISVTLNRLSAGELEKLAEVARGVGAELEFNILSRNLFFLQNADVASMWPERGEVLTGCYPLKPVGNVLRDSLADILASEAYRRQAVAMIRRECPGCTCGIESSLAMKHAAASAFFELSRLTRRRNSKTPACPITTESLEEVSRI